jgi:hypothetical protein
MIESVRSVAMKDSAMGRGCEGSPGL